MNVSILIQVFLSNPVDEADKLFISGNQPCLGNWKPGKVKLEKENSSLYRRQIEVPKGEVVEFKITRGSWKTQAVYGSTDEDSRPDNQMFVASRSMIFPVKVSDWVDRMPLDLDPIVGDLRMHDDFPSPGLAYNRDISVWLPPSYRKSKNRYPVLYMHDGQNLFDPAISFCGQDWKVDEVVSRLIKKGKMSEIIVVGIGNTPDRLKEYNFFTRPGREYARFLRENLKPFIDKTYRTMPAPENTATMGSSMGGLYAFQLVWEFPETFSMAGCLSPAFFKSASRIYRRVAENRNDPPKGKIYLDGGEMEPEFAVCVSRMHEVLLPMGFRENNNIFSWIVPEANHSESAWASRIHVPLLFFFGKPGEFRKVRPPRGF